MLPRVDPEHQHPKLLPLRPVIRYDLSWEASKIFGFSNILKVQPLYMSRSASVFNRAQQIVFCLMHVLRVPHLSSETRVLLPVSLMVCSRRCQSQSLSCTSRNSLRLLLLLKSRCGWCGNITPFSQLPQSCRSLLCRGALTTPISHLLSLSETGLTTNL